ncbi:MAG: 4Fe-4S binding protein [Christensenellales bacterium]|jgi:ferredoxin-type protein NapH
MKKKRNLRHAIQVVFTALTNAYVVGFVKGTVYSGPLKKICVPGLNCYACPGALGACPIGSLQAVLGSSKYRFSYYVVGFLMAFGALCGRLICGFLCPFGLVQDILHKLPLPRRWKLKKITIFKGDMALRKLKYAILAVFVILLPMLLFNEAGVGTPWFCKLICPAGTLGGGVPLVTVNETLSGMIGWLFDWKLLVLFAVLLLSVVLYRPFCKYLCPLGAIYSFFNKVSFYRMGIDPEKCIRCGACEAACKMNVPVLKDQNHPECIRCGDCKRACPKNAISSGFAPCGRQGQLKKTRRTRTDKLI